MKYQNPVLRGMYPDPSVCRVGNTFYMVCSSMQLFPGVPLFESQDMIHWNQIGHCLTRKSQVDLDGVRSSGGIFAPTIRYNNGRFYMVTTNDSYHQNFYVYTDDIYGEWSEPVIVDQDGIDPSLFFENGHSYFISNGADVDGKGCIQMCEIDISTGNKITPSKVLWKGTGGRFLEAPHLYHFNDYYYLLEAEGGTEYGHMVNYARSKNMWGPFESYPGNPVLTNRNLGGYSIQGAGHGDIVDDGNGNWWFVHLAFRQIDKWFTFHHLGREVCVVPLYWHNDGWFSIGMNGTCPIECDCPKINTESDQQFEIKKTFSNMTKNDWTFLRIPSSENYQFLPNCLMLRGTDVTLNDVGSPTFTGIRQCEFNIDLTCTIEATEAEAGISFYMDEHHHYEIIVKKENKRTIAFSRQTIGVLCSESKHVPLDTDQAIIHITSNSIQYQFFIQTSDKTDEILLSPAETRYLSSEVAGGFTGVIIGFFSVQMPGEEACWSKFTDLRLEMFPER